MVKSGQYLFYKMVEKKIWSKKNGRKKIGWDKKKIESYLLKWNKEKNSGNLRDNYIVSQMKSFTAAAKLPPNCDNEAYYTGIGICFPDTLCKKIKNPVNYTLIRWKRHLRDREEKGNTKKSKKSDNIEISEKSE